MTNEVGLVVKMGIFVFKTRKIPNPGLAKKEFVVYKDTQAQDLNQIW